MSIQQNHLHTDFRIETWKEEFSRAKKFKEATQKRKIEKLVQTEMERIKKKATIGRLK